MVSEIELETIDAVPPGSSVGHYDELEPTTKAQFFELATASRTGVRDEVRSELERYDVVKFTDYYRVRIN